MQRKQNYDLAELERVSVRGYNTPMDSKIPETFKSKEIYSLRES